MGEYASLRVWKKLENAKGSIYDRIHQMRLQGMKENDAYKEMNLDFWEFGRVEYQQIADTTYYSRTPNNFREQMKYLLECKYDISAAWLMCFEFSEFQVDKAGSIQDDGDYGIFTAGTTVKQARERISNVQYTLLDFENQNLRDQVIQVETFLQQSDDDDIIRISSDMIFYSPDGEFGVKYVKEMINSKIKSIRELFSIPHWRKRPSSQEA